MAERAPVTAETAYKDVVTGYWRNPTAADIKWGQGQRTKVTGGFLDLTGAKYDPITERVVDAEATAGNWARAYGKAGESLLGEAGDNLKKQTSLIQGALVPIMQNGSGIDDYLQLATQNYGKINQYAEEAKAAASDITNQVADVNKSAGEITNLATQLGEYAPILKAMGDTMFGEGGDLVLSGEDYITSGRSLLGLDKNAGGLAGTYAQVLAMLDPSLAVTTAANDTRAAFEQTQKASQRALARQGVTAGSGRSAAMMQQAGQALAAALAGIKTKTRQSSVESYLAAMRGAVADAANLGATGSGIVTQGVNAQAQGAAAMKSAAGILVDQGQLHAAAANARTQAGQLLGTQANALTAAGQLTVAGGNLALGAANAKVADTNSRVNAANASLNAAKTDYDADSTLASYYAGMFNQMATVAGTKLFG